MYASSSRWKSATRRMRNWYVRIDQPHEVEERGLAEALLDHADDLAAPVVAHAEQVDEVAELRHLLHGRLVLAAADGAVQAVNAVVVAVDVRQPLQAGADSCSKVVVLAARSGSCRRWLK